jgi:hypothetical protein
MWLKGRRKIWDEFQPIVFVYKKSNQEDGAVIAKTS